MPASQQELKEENHRLRVSQVVGEAERAARTELGEVQPKEEHGLQHEEKAEGAGEEEAVMVDAPSGHASPSAPAAAAMPPPPGDGHTELVEEMRRALTAAVADREAARSEVTQPAEHNMPSARCDDSAPSARLAPPRAL